MSAARRRDDRAADVVWPEPWRWLESIDVRCPSCHAPPGQTCDWRGGRTANRHLLQMPSAEVARTPHLVRVDRAVLILRRRRAMEPEE